MYEIFYKLSAAPFLLTPDNRFFYESRVHARAIAHLQFGLAQGEGFIVITGEVGAGKTTLVERLWEQLDRDAYLVARVGTTQLGGDDLFRLALAGFGMAVEGSGTDKAALLLRFQQVLREHRVAGRRCLLVVDEVQNLSPAALEELRMLSNLTDAGHAGLQTVLVGQPQFRRMLASPDLSQLAQRVLSSYHLGPLNPADTQAYVEHRLSTVGWDGSNPQWEPDAYSAVWRCSGGIPRRINRLCGRVLLYGALEVTRTITGAMVTTTAQELDADLNGTDLAGAAPLVAERSAADRMGSDRIALGDGAPALVAALRRELMEGDLLARVEALEHQVARRERIFQRLLDVLGRAQ
jgi:putative secretion ATPase (PEP-CTERM system associated)